MKANSDKSKQGNKATRRVLAGVLCGASVLSLVLSLVMPPISQAIANDDQAAFTEEAVADENTLGEEAGAGNSTGKDAENRKSDDAEGGEGEDAVTEGQPSDDTKVESDTQSADDGANGDGAIALTAGNESPYTINSGDELSKKLLNENLRDKNGAATFELAADIEYDEEIKLEGANTNITLKLNGFKIKHDSDNKPLFDVANDATFTVEGSVPAPETIDNGQPLQNRGKDLTPANYGKTAEMDYDSSSGIPTKLTYYVTESTASGTRTTEKIYKHEATIGGRNCWSHRELHDEAH